MDLKLDIKVLYEDDNVLVIDKPAGLMTHGDGRNSEPTLADWIIEKYPEMKEVGEPFVKGESVGSVQDIYVGRDIVPKQVIYRPGIVHRLDKDTSGVMIIAKNQKSYLYLKEQFVDREIEKKYLALVYDNFKNDEGQVDRPIGKSPKDFRLRSAASNAKGKLREAVTDYKVIERFLVRDKVGDDFSLLEVSPKTGRTHQIRVHMKETSHPVVCDHLYSASKKCPEGISRQMLHAHSLGLKLPDGEEKMFVAEMPTDMARFLESLRAL